MLCSDGGSRDNRVHRQPSHWIYAGKVHRQPCHVSCILYLGFTALAHHILVLHRHHFLDLRRPPYLGFTPIGHHIMSHLVLISHLVLLHDLFYMQHWCRSDLGQQPTWPAIRETHAEQSHTNIVDTHAKKSWKAIITPSIYIRAWEGLLYYIFSSLSS